MKSGLRFDDPSTSCMHACSTRASALIKIDFVFAYGFLGNIRNETGCANIALIREPNENLRMPRRSSDEQATFPISSSFLLDVLNFFDMRQTYPSRASRSAALLAA